MASNANPAVLLFFVFLVPRVDKQCAGFLPPTQTLLAQLRQERFANELSEASLTAAYTSWH